MNKLENKYINNNLKELHALYKVWRAKEYAGTSRFVPAFERRLEAYFGSPHAVAVSNGTDAIEVAVRALGLQHGDEVLMPAYAPVMSVIPLLHYGLTPIFVDSEPGVFNLSIADIKRKCTKKTKALLAVPMWGYPIAMQPLQTVCKEKGMKLIEDASHCHGSKLAGQFVGTLSDISTFSTQERKMIATGEGGFVLTANDTVYSKALSIRDFGKVQQGDTTYPDHINEYGYYDGSNFRISGASAGIGEVQVGKLEKKIAARTSNARTILRGIGREERYTELRNADDTHNNYYSLVLQLHDLDAKKLGEFLAERNIISDTHRFKIRPLYAMPQFSMYASACPNTEALLRSIVTIPTHEGLGGAELRLITDSLLAFAAR